MKKLIIILILLIPFLNTNAQGIGKLAPEKPPVEFPDNSVGVDIVFSEGGIGFGGFYRHSLSRKFTFFTDISISESKDDQEVVRIDPFTLQPFTLFKLNRVFVVPLNFGLQYRLFTDEIYDNLRPYINFGVGPTLVVTTPNNKEFFKAFGDAQSKYALGGYIGFGANFGIDKSNLIGLNVRYYFIRLFDEGVEGLFGKYRKNLDGIFLAINIGFMY
ncbi:MAG: hypothetical protein COW08_06385 [Ignavibacteriales bacterium CG12_big_fil_rev_8_21_14_0_65_30_8]|nr:MAG: hypothetical protein COW08_06385 [Ignavibacteriales bacterium CG12_big_fil_rev_8_21_14_0_65_30_8]